MKFDLVRLQAIWKRKKKKVMQAKKRKEPKNWYDDTKLSKRVIYNLQYKAWLNL